MFVQGEFEGELALVVVVVQRREVAPHLLAIHLEHELDVVVEGAGDELRQGLASEGDAHEGVAQRFDAGDGDVADVEFMAHALYAQAGRLFHVGPI